MRGVLVKEYTEFQNLRIEDCPEPAIGPGQLRIRTQAAGVSFATSLMVAGRYQRKPPLPFIPGTEAAGIVSEIGAGVTRFQVGDRVACVLDWGGLGEALLVLLLRGARVRLLHARPLGVVLLQLERRDAQVVRRARRDEAVVLARAARRARRAAGGS